MFQRLLRPCFGIYYRYCSLVNRLLPNITLDGHKLRVFPGVYKPLDAEHHLVDHIDPGKKVLDVGCGSGVLTLFAALKSQHVTAIDINPQAVENTKLNCQGNGIENVTVKTSDMFNDVDGRFDYIISYPPLFRVPFASSDQQWCTSTYFVDELFKHAKDYLKPEGRIVVMLPYGYEPKPQTIADQNDLILESDFPQQKRPLAIRLHAIPYLHLNMDNHVYTFRF
jgi:release factor glutamine methyltransferase